MVHSYDKVFQNLRWKIIMNWLRTGKVQSYQITINFMESFQSVIIELIEVL